MAVLFVGGAYLGSWGVATNPGVDAARAAALFLFAPISAAGYLLVIQLRDGPGGHPIGQLRRFLPLSRRRSAALRLAEDTLQPGTLFVVAYTAATWLGVATSGERWLSGAGWITLALLVVVGLAGRHAVNSFQAWALESSGGSAAAIVRIGLTVGLISLPAWVSLVTPFIPWSRFDPLGPSTVDAANGAMGVFLAGTAALGLTALAIWLRTCRGLRVGFRLPSRRSERAQKPLRFHGGRAEYVILRMMLIQASRQATFRYAAGLLLLFGLLGRILPGGTSVGLILLSGFLAPVTAFYNLYGADARSYHLWLGSGRALEEWTRARQLFNLCYIAIFLYGSGLLLVVGGRIPLSAVPGLLALPIAAAAIAIAAGPSVSRFVVAPQSAEVGFKSRSQSSPRAMFATFAAVITGMVVLIPGIILAQGEYWWICWLLALGATVAMLATLPFQASWSPELRTRMASTFRG